MTPDQMWEGRLAARTPVPGLYLCGAATHPAGSVIAPQRAERRRGRARRRGCRARRRRLARGGRRRRHALGWIHGGGERSAVGRARRQGADPRGRLELIAADGIDEVRIARVANRARRLDRPRPSLLLHPRGAARAGAPPVLRARGGRALRGGPGRGRLCERGTGRSRSTSACRPPGRRSASGCSGSSSGCAPPGSRSCARWPGACTRAIGSGWPRVIRARSGERRVQR